MAQPRLIRRPPAERVLAWIYTGPLGHLWGAVADISELWVRWRLSRASIRLRRIREQGPWA